MPVRAYLTGVAYLLEGDMVILEWEKGGLGGTRTRVTGFADQFLTPRTPGHDSVYYTLKQPLSLIFLLFYRVFVSIGTNEGFTFFENRLTTAFLHISGRLLNSFYWQEKTRSPAGNGQP